MTAAGPERAAREAPPHLLGVEGFRRSPLRRSPERRSATPGGGPTLAFRRSVPRRSRARRSVLAVTADLRVASLNSFCSRTVRRAGSSTSSKPSCADRACASSGGLPKRSLSNCAALRIDSRCQLCSGLIRKIPESAINRSRSGLRAPGTGSKGSLRKKRTHPLSRGARECCEG